MFFCNLQACPIESFLPLLEAFRKLDLPRDVRILDLCSGTGRLGQLVSITYATPHDIRSDHKLSEPDIECKLYAASELVGVHVVLDKTKAMIQTPSESPIG